MFRLRAMSKKDLELVLEWRNRPEIRENMYTTHTISKKEHYRYFDEVWEDPTIEYFVCETINNEPVGVVYFTKINFVDKNAFWGFYSGDLKQHGIGTWIGFLAMNHSFDSLNLIKLNSEVLSYNLNSIDFHRKLGFKIEGIFHNHHKCEDGYVDVYRLAMLRNDWVKYQKSYFEKKLHGKLKTEQFKVNTKFEESFFLSKNKIGQFCTFSGNKNPLHLDDKFAINSGFNGLICHGMFAGAVFSRIIGTKFPGVGSICLKQNFKFSSPIYPDINLKSCFKVISKVGRKVIIETIIKDLKGNILVEGEAEVLIPK